MKLNGTKMFIEHVQQRDLTVAISGAMEMKTWMKVVLMYNGSSINLGRRRLEILNAITDGVDNET